MYTCTHCKNKFKNKPLIGSNNKKYCSIRCIPDSLIDEAYSSEYFKLNVYKCGIWSDCSKYDDYYND